MTLRERNLLAVLVGIAVVIGGALAVRQWLYKPLVEANRARNELIADVAQKRELIDFVRHEQKRLEKYKVLSLPSNPDQAAADYSNYLNTLLRNGGLTVSVKGPPANLLKAAPPQGKKAGHVVLPFTVSATGEIRNVVKTLEELKNAPIAHRVKSLALTPADPSSREPSKLSLQMTIEALIVYKADSFHPYLSTPDSSLVLLESIAGLRGAPLGMAVGPWAISKATVQAIVKREPKSTRNYGDIPNRNLFAGLLPEPPSFDPGPIDGGLDVRSYIKLVHTDPSAKEAFLRNYVFRSRELRLKATKGSGYDVFRITNEDGDVVLVKGKVLRVDQRDVYFQVGEDIYGIHIGQSLADAMRRPLFLEETDELQVTQLYDEAFASQEMSAKNPKAAQKSKTPTGKAPFPKQPTGKTPGKTIGKSPTMK